MKFTKKLNSDELKMACSILYAHFGRYFVDCAEDLAKEVSLNFDCDCKDYEVHKYVNIRTIEEEDRYLLIKNLE